MNHPSLCSSLLIFLQTHVKTDPGILWRNTTAVIEQMITAAICKQRAKSKRRLPLLSSLLGSDWWDHLTKSSAEEVRGRSLPLPTPFVYLTEPSLHWHPWDPFRPARFLLVCAGLRSSDTAVTTPSMWCLGNSNIPYLFKYWSQLNLSQGLDYISSNKWFRNEI